MIAFTRCTLRSLWLVSVLAPGIAGAVDGVPALPGTTGAPSRPTLLPPNPVPSPTTPGSLSYIPGPPWTGVIRAIAAIGPLFNEKATIYLLEKNFKASLDRAWQEAVKHGQSGVLMKVQVLEEKTDSGRFISLRGDGAFAVGYGSSADAVCFAERCYNRDLSEYPLKPGQSLAPGSGYVWVTKKEGGKYAAEGYSFKSLEERAANLRANDLLSRAYSEVANTAAFSDYARSLRGAANKRADKIKIDALLKSRDDAVDKSQELERELAKELRRADEVAKAAKILGTLTSIFGLASAVAMVNQSLGEDIAKYSTDGTITDTASANNALSGLGTSAQNNIQRITLTQSTLRITQTEFESQITQLGIRYGRTVPVPVKP